MKTRYKILIVITITLMSLLSADQYYLSLQDKEIKKSNWVQNCIPVGSDGIVPAVGLFNHTHSFDLKTCSWEPTEHGIPGFLESLYISFIEPIFSDIAEHFETKYAYASCFFTDDYENRDRSKHLCSDVTGFNDVEIHDGWIAPLKQYRAGIDPYNVICNGNLILIQKHDGSPACVTSETKQKLIERGWATNNPVKETNNDPPPKYYTPEFDAEYEKVSYIYRHVRGPMDLPFTGLTTDVNDRGTILLGINSDKLTEEKDQAYYNALVDQLLKSVNADVLIVYHNITGIDVDQ